MNLECSDISPNSWLSRKLKDKWTDFCTVRVPADGDCLFSSIRVACAVSGNIDYKTKTLRAAVANTILDVNNERITELLKNWLSMYSDALKDNNLSMAREYAQMDGIDKSFDPESRKKLYKHMMDKNIYWGDQHALMTFEDILGVRFIILTPEAKGASFVYRDDNHVESDIPVTHVILLSLNNRHYEPIGYTGAGKVKFAFTVEDIPEVVETLCKAQ